MLIAAQKSQRLLDQVLVKGHPFLAQVCAPVTNEMLRRDTFHEQCTRLCETLLAFRVTHGYGRAMAAPQIGINLRMIALNLAACANYNSVYRHRLSRPVPLPTTTTTRGINHSDKENLVTTLHQDCLVLLNPQLTFLSTTTRTVWDDCLSLPNMLVRVKRHETIGVQWMDHYGKGHVWEPANMQFDLAELIQHEMDHLDGILATDRVEPLSGSKQDEYPAIISREDFEAQKEFYQSYVDCTI